MLNKQEIQNLIKDEVIERLKLKVNIDEDKSLNIILKYNNTEITNKKLKLEDIVKK